MSVYVYRAYDSAGRLLYIGYTNNPVSRFMSHRSQGSTWLPYAASVSWEPHSTRRAGLAAESAAIEAERPPYNERGNRAGRAVPDSEMADIALMDLLRGAPGRVETVYDRKRDAMRALRARGSVGMTTLPIPPLEAVHAARGAES